MNKKVLSGLVASTLCLSMLVGCGANDKVQTPSEPNNETSIPEIRVPVEIEGVKIEMTDDEILVDGEKITNDESQAVYVANDIVYYEDGHDFTYGEGTENDAHSKDEADKHTVVHITQPGSYVLSGFLSAGQVAVDLGKEAKEDPEAVVTLYLNGVDITNTVAPAVIFYNVYEPFADATEETATKDINTLDAGARVVIVDNTVNNVTGSHVARIYKPDSVVLSSDGKKVEDSKKLHKYDAAFYSKMTMEVNGGDIGNGILNIYADNEGLDTELHLTINGGKINIESGNDGINTNEDNISVTTINGGDVNIIVNGGTGEGDGIDSNGWLVINGGTLVSQGCGFSMDGGIDSDRGIHINGGTVFATGNMLDEISPSMQNFVVFNFVGSQSAGKYSLKNSDGVIIAEYDITNNFSNLIVSAKELVEGDYTLWMGDTQFAGAKTEAMNGMGRPGMGGDFTPPEGMEFPKDFDPNNMKPVAPPDEYRDGTWNGGGNNIAPPAPDDNSDIHEIQFPVGGMPTNNNNEIPVEPSYPENNWNVNKNRVGITGGSAITMEIPEKITPPEGGFTGGFPGGSDAGFGSGPMGKPGNGSSWGASSSEISTTFNIVDGANYFSSLRKVSAVE